MSSYAITGASRGLGFEFISQLSSNPSNTVFALVRSPSTATKLQELAASHPNVHIIQCDVGIPSEVLAAAAATSKITSGTLDVLVHNAADTSDMAALSISPTGLSPNDPAAVHKMFEAAMETAVYGALWVTNAFLPLIEKGTQKKIVHITSGMADIDLVRTTEISYAVPYAVAKAGMNILAAKYAVELKSKGIKVLALSPGWVDTFQGHGKYSNVLIVQQTSRLMWVYIVPPEMQETLMGLMQAMLGSFQKLEPSLKGPIMPEESVRLQLEVIGALDGQMSGKFVSHHGDLNWF
jgi:NAD(P)-dependent dehydrogenase (short-subunit alcohol dehydrogenase family)